jgi:hypothetical protein
MVWHIKPNTLEHVEWVTDEVQALLPCGALLALDWPWVLTKVTRYLLRLCGAIGITCSGCLDNFAFLSPLGKEATRIWLQVLQDMHTLRWGF